MLRLARVAAEGGKELARDAAAAHCELAEMVASRLGFPAETCGAVKYSEERWDGKGMVYGLKGPDTPLPARIIHLAQVFDAVHVFAGKETALATLRQRAGSDSDPVLTGLLLDLAKKRDFWAFLSQESLEEPMLSMRPSSAIDLATDEQIEVVCESAANFSDMVSSVTWNHGLKVAGLAGDIGRSMGLSAHETTALRRLGLVHDLGKATVPSLVVQRAALGEPLASYEIERYRLHPYYTEQILSRVSLFGPGASGAAAHHERMDGTGFPKRMPGAQIPLAGRVLAVADAYALASSRAGEPSVEKTLDELRPLVGTHLDGDCYAALRNALDSGEPMPLRQRHQRASAALSERETEVLRLVAEGLTNRQVAGRLVISNKTVEHHVEHIFDKLGVTSRTSAAMWGVQNGLIG